MEWYEELDFEEDPFVDNESTSLVGYESIIDEVLYRIDSGGMVFVEGSEGSGKTAILKKAIARFKGSGKVVYLDGKGVRDEPNIEKVISGKLNFFSRFFRKTPHDIILLMDEVQELSKKNTERLKYFYDQNYIRSIVLTGKSFASADFSSSFKERISKIVKLRKLSEDEAVNAVKTRLENKDVLPEEVIKSVYLKSNNMKEFLLGCEELCKHSVGKDGVKVTPDNFSAMLKKEVPGESSDDKRNPVEDVKPEDKPKEPKEGLKEEIKSKEPSKEPKKVSKKEDIAEEYY